MYFDRTALKLTLVSPPVGTLISLAGVQPELLPALTSVCLSVVAELEKKFKSNEQRMQKQRMELDELKQNATVVRDEIREQVQKYSNCV